MRTVARAVAPATLFCLCQLAFAQTPLRAGAAKAVITPDLQINKVYLAGFGHNRIATAVHDDLYVRCLALEAGDQTFAMCSADLIGLFYDDVLKIRAEVKSQAPEISHLIVASTHVHEGPDTLGLWGPTPLQTGIDSNYLDWLDSQIAATAVKAARSAQPAWMQFASDDDPLLEKLQAVDRPPLVKDPHMLVVRITRADTGDPIAVLVNWSDHPETLGRENTEVTADYAHWLCQYAEDRLGGTAIFFNGSIGKVSTLGEQVGVTDPATGAPAEDRSWKKAELIGTTLGQLAERDLRSGLVRQVDSFIVRKSVLFVPLENDRFRLAEATGVFSGRKPLYTAGKLDRSTVKKVIPDVGEVEFPTGRDIQTEVDYIELRCRGHVVAQIVTVPGEIYPELTVGGITRYPGADFPSAPFEPTLRAHLKSPYQFIIGLGNDELGYLIPKAEWDEKPPWLLNSPQRWYGEINSVGPDAAGVVLRELAKLGDQR